MQSFDLFISHASEDKEEIARPLAEHLRAKGYNVWFDEMTLKLGDSLRRNIDKGLSASKFGVVIFSPSFFEKQWPQYELDSLVQIELNRGSKCILPIWHKVTHKDVFSYSPSLADKVADVSTLGLERLCTRISDVIGAPSLAPQPQLLRPATTVAEIDDEEKCPKCGQKGEIFGYDGSEGDSFCWFECNHCGHFQPLTA